jgi:PIN domain nuclease of toxin-antitoxin system
VKHLLDSDALLWYTLNDPKLSNTAEALILDPANEILISPASYWEIAIKISIGKLTLHQPYEDFIDVCLNKYGFVILPVETKHTAWRLSEDGCFQVLALFQSVFIPHFR